jgi:hypothetical protein
MKFEIIDAPKTKAIKKWKYMQIADLAVGKALVIPFSALDPHEDLTEIRNRAYYYGRRLNMQFSTRKRADDLLIIRVG